MRGVINKRGVSAIVATVLIILITVAAVTIIWAAIIPMIDERLTLSNSCLDAVRQVSIVSVGSTCYSQDSSSLKVQIKRGPEGIDISDIMVSLDDDIGNSFTALTGSVPGLNGVNIFIFPFTGSGFPSSVSVAPVITLGNAIETCDISSTLTEIPKCKWNSGLFSWWKFDENPGGITASDSEGGRYGTLFETVDFTTDESRCKFGNCLNVSSSGYVTVPSFDLTGDSMSITAWIYADSFLGNGQNRIISKATGTGEINHYFMVSSILSPGGSELRSRFKTRGSGGTVNTLTHKGGDLRAGEFTHIAVVYDGTNVRHYINGELFIGSMTGSGAGEQTGNLTSSGRSVVIGANVNGTDTGYSNQWDGTIDDLRIYDRALSDSEVLALANPTP
jgi:hypothetical protein